MILHKSAHWHADRRTLVIMDDSGPTMTFERHENIGIRKAREIAAATGAQPFNVELCRRVPR